LETFFFQVHAEILHVVGSSLQEGVISNVLIVPLLSLLLSLSLPCAFKVARHLSRGLLSEIGFTKPHIEALLADAAAVDQENQQECSSVGGSDSSGEGGGRGEACRGSGGHKVSHKIKLPNGGGGGGSSPVSSCSNLSIIRYRETADETACGEVGKAGGAETVHCPDHTDVSILTVIPCARGSRESSDGKNMFYSFYIRYFSMSSPTRANLFT
jgi:hypothetical protein